MADWVVFRLSALGDVTLMTGVLDHAHAEKGHRFIVITRQKFVPLFKNLPAVRDVVGVPSGLSFVATIKLFQGLARRYASHPLLDWHATLRSRLLGLVWKGAVYRYDKASLTRRIFLATRRHINPTPFAQKLANTHVTQRYAETLGIAAPSATFQPKLVLTGEEKDVAGKQLAPLRNSGNGPIIALHPYATHSNKAWDRTNWQQLIQLLHARQCICIIVGQCSDKQNPIAGLLPSEYDFTNRTELRETAALLSVCDALVTGDSGPMHIACGVKTPVLALFGPTSRHWGFFPQGPQHKVVELPYACRPCSLHGQGPCPHERRCMRDIAPCFVMDCLQQMLERQGK